MESRIGWDGIRVIYLLSYLILSIDKIVSLILSLIDLEFRTGRAFHPVELEPTALSHRAAMAAAAGIKVSSRFNLVLNAGKATPQPPVGSALGQRGLNLMNFCKAFNDETAKFKDTVPIRVRAAHRSHRTPRALRTHRCKRLQVRVTAFADRTFTYETKGPSSTYLLLKAAGIEKGADKPGYETVGKLSVKHIYEIAKVRVSNSLPGSVLHALDTPTHTNRR